VSARVAVVVPCFNDGATIRETLASLAGEEPHELVVVDDGSDEPVTLAVLAELEDQGVRVVRQENRGLAGARMTGVAATQAPYVQPLDADDLLVPGALALLADALDRHPGAQLAWGDVAVFGSFEHVVRMADRLDPWYLTYLDEVPPTPMLRRSALVESGGWTFADVYEDWDLWLAFAERGWDGVRVAAPTIRYRRTQPRMSAAGLDRQGELVELLRGRHQALWAARRVNRRRSRAPLRTKLLFPLLERAPLAPRDRHRLLRLVAHPQQALSVRRARVRAEART
jgi:glycosyltransferase involved in cell wall biosynthesis